MVSYINRNAWHVMAQKKFIHLIYIYICKIVKTMIILNQQKKIGSFSLIERVILSAGAMLIFSVSFPTDRYVSSDAADSAWSELTN